MTSEPTRPSAGQAHLSAFDIGCVVVGGIIGVGIFFTPQKVAAAVDTPQQVILAWSLGGVFAVLGALVFAELSTLVPGHGGTFRYIQVAFGRLPAFLYGWANWLVIQAGALGVIGLVLVGNLQIALFGSRTWSPLTEVLIAAAIMLFFTATNVLGLRTGKRVQNALTVTKVAALAFLVLLSWVKPAHAPEPLPAPQGTGLTAMLAAAILPVLFAIGGWQQGSFLAGAAKRPRLDVPLGILGGVAVVIITYLTVNLAYLDLLGFAGARANKEIGAAAATAALGQGGGRVLAAMVVVSAAGIMNTICLAPPYVLYAMAQQGVFPPAFGRLHATFGTPVLGVLGQGVWSVVLLLTVHFVFAGGGSTIDTLGLVCDGVVFADWLFYGLCGAALLRLRGSREGALVVPGGALAAVLFLLCGIGVGVGAIWQNWNACLPGTAMIAAGLPAYWLLMRRAK